MNYSSKSFLLKLARPGVLALLIIVFAGCSALTKKHEKVDIEYFNINPSGKTKLVLNNVNGNIKIKDGPDSNISVRAEKIAYVSKKDMDKKLDNISILIDTSGNVIRIDSETRKKKSLFSFSFKKNDKVNYDIELPPNFDVQIDNTNGNVNISGLQGEIETDIINGNIKLDNVTGKTVLDITNGKVNAALDSSNGLKVNIINGSVKLELGNSFGGKFVLDVTNGKINYNDIKFDDVVSDKKSLKGNLGDSDSKIQIDVTNGKITLERKKNSASEI